ncbi:MAG: hypothetical protein AAF702_25625 [Chloroflexota bacterium]
MNKWIKQLLNWISPKREYDSMPMDPKMVKGMLEGIINTRADEIDCDECFAQVDYFVEMHLDDDTAAQKLPLVADHLKRCKDCKEEFDMLVLALEAIN